MIKGAETFSYLIGADARNLLYALNISKSELVEPSLGHRLLYLPSTSVFYSFVSGSEYFHPRITDDRLLESDSEELFQQWLNQRVIPILIADQ